MSFISPPFLIIVFFDSPCIHMVLFFFSSFFFSQIESAKSEVYQILSHKMKYKNYKGTNFAKAWKKAALHPSRTPNQPPRGVLTLTY